MANIIFTIFKIGFKQTEVIRIIKTGIVGNDRTVIVGGLQAGDQIITFGYQDVVDGQIITTGTK